MSERLGFPHPALSKGSGRLILTLICMRGQSSDEGEMAAQSP